jgi:murein L,D-transpeptidase YafK
MTRRASWSSLVIALSLACGEAHRTATPHPASATVGAAPPPSAFLAGCAASPVELPASPLYDPADPRLREPAVLVAHKSARRLMLFAQGRLQECWAMGLGFDPRGHKQREGDGRTPEGWYRTSDKPWSDFAGAIAVHYPNDRDARAALADGRLAAPELEVVRDALAHDVVPPQATAVGGEILIHGGGSGRDWTLGCMALEDDDLSRLRTTLPSDQRVWLLVLP